MPNDPRAYITLTLDFPDHPKFAGWSDSARFKLIRLWVYCALHHSDGFVPTTILRQICRKDVVELLRKLDGVAFLEDGSGIQFLDYTEHQRSRADVDAQRGKASSAGVKSGAVRRQKSRGKAVTAATDQVVRHRTEKEEDSSLKDLRPSDYDLSKNKNQGDPPKPPADANVLFDEWWECYPRKVGKPAARRAFNSALRKMSYVELISLTRVFITDPNLPAGDEAQFIPHPATWLNQERWNDLPLPTWRKKNQRKTAEERAMSAIQIGQQLRRTGSSTEIVSPEFAVEFDPPRELKAAG
ncbi:hypothetical protein NONI108955_21275 [Nocardia ninae]|uniref:Lin1244/Lin1753-like N-terminal domain-containing protein n=1 Tax=Nocardia ninae NBRC 108245 TaxID=1210091 RepID=A0A511MBC6_9NOCA|nr:hypothetical protein [Nocardia ninae]GEM37487.1 hypothetical protein NN4_20060 [Nocardia ninae NBRC 108245]